VHDIGVYNTSPLCMRWPEAATDSLPYKTGCREIVPWSVNPRGPPSESLAGQDRLCAKNRSGVMIGHHYCAYTTYQTSHMSLLLEGVESTRIWRWMESGMCHSAREKRLRARRGAERVVKACSGVPGGSLKNRKSESTRTREQLGHKGQSFSVCSECSA